MMTTAETGLPFTIRFCIFYIRSVFCFATEKYNFLGISIVGQSNDKGDGGIYIGSIMKG